MDNRINDSQTPHQNHLVRAARNELARQKPTPTRTDLTDRPQRKILQRKYAQHKYQKKNNQHNDSFTVKVKRKFDAARHRIYNRFAIYTQSYDLPLGLHLDILI